MVQGTILTVGSLNMDEVVHTPRLPALGETLLGAGSLKLVPGGKGANRRHSRACGQRPLWRSTGQSITGGWRGYTTRVR